MIISFNAKFTRGTKKRDLNRKQWGEQVTGEKGSQQLYASPTKRKEA